MSDLCRCGHDHIHVTRKRERRCIVWPCRCKQFTRARGMTQESFDAMPEWARYALLHGTATHPIELPPVDGAA